MFYDIALTKRNELDDKIKSLQAQITDLPTGDFFCSRNDKRYKWFRNNGEKQIYIPKKDRTLAEKLAVKKYLSYQLEELQQEKKAIEFYLRHHHTSTLTKQLLAHPEYQNLLKPYFSLADDLASWVNSPYNHNSLHPEHLIHKTISGNLVRSKSEMLIDMILYTNRIPFRYECGLQLGEAIAYPDFTIMHPVTGQIYYWEHFGLMDVPEYCQNAESKLHLYISHGIIPSLHLITTYETKKQPLEPSLVESIVKHYFL